jgi:hypothetical protein
MNILELLANVTIVDTDGYDVGEVLAFHIIGGDQLVVTVDPEVVSDPDDGERDPIPEEEVESIMRVVAGGGAGA